MFPIKVFVCWLAAGSGDPLSVRRSIRAGNQPEGWSGDFPLFQRARGLRLGAVGDDGLPLSRGSSPSLPQTADLQPEGSLPIVKTSAPHPEGLPTEGDTK